MGEWAITMTVAELVMRDSRYRRLRRLPDAAVQAAVLLDLAAARLVTAGDDRLGAGAARSGFAPADRLLDIVSAGDADVGQLIWRGSIEMRDVVAEFLTRGWWVRDSRQRWIGPIRYRPSDIALTRMRDRNADRVADLLVTLLNGKTDTDEIQTAADQSSYGAATWLIGPVFHELIELRWWLQAAASTPGPGGGA